MRRFFYGTYRYALRILGQYGLFLSALAVISLYLGWSRGLYVGPLAVLAIVTLATSLVMTIPRLTPGWIERPDSALKGGMVFLLSALVVMLFVVFGMSTIIPLQIQEPLSRTIAFSMSGVSALFGTIMGWSALFYGILPDRQDSDPDTPANE